MNIIDKITIVILSRGRNLYLERTVKYYISEGFKVLVVHQTDAKFRLKIKSPKLIYYKSSDHYYERFIQAAKIVNTKYSILVNDDEFVFKQFIKKSIIFLDRNKSYATVCGKVLTFFMKEKKIFYDYGYKNFGKEVLKSANIKGRIIFHINNPSNHGYNSVMKSSDFKRIALFLKKFPHPGNIFFVEFCINLLIASFGKSKFLNSLYWLRSFENEWIDEKKWNRKTKFQNPYLWIEKQKKEKIKKYISILTNSIEKKDKKFKILILNVILENLFVYIKFFKKKYVLTQKRDIKNEIKMLLSKSKKILRKFFIFDLIIGFLYKLNFFNFNYGYSFDQIKNKLKNTNTHYKSLEFYRVKKILDEFYNL